MNFLLDENGTKICCICKNPFDNIEAAISYYAFYCEDYFGVHKECYEKAKESYDQETWDQALRLIKTDKLHCIRCTQQLNSKNVSNLHTDVDRTSYKCPECDLEFTIYHGEPDCGDYYYYQEEQEAKEYLEAMKLYKVRLKKWEDDGSPKGSRPIPPRTPEEERIDEANIRKYGEH